MFGKDDYFSKDIKLLRPMDEREKKEREEKKKKLSPEPIISTVPKEHTIPKEYSNSNYFPPTKKEIKDALDAISAFQERKLQKKRNSLFGRVKKHLGVKEGTRCYLRDEELVKEIERGVIPIEVSIRINLARWHQWEAMNNSEKKKYEKKTWLKMFFSFPSFS